MPDLTNLYHLLHRVLDILFPRKALIRELESMTAAEFIAKVPRSTFISRDKTCLAFFSYRHPLMRQAVWEIKYANNKRVFRLLGQVLGVLLCDEILNGHNLTPKNRTVLIPLPISTKRRRERGYNQTEELVKMVRDPNTHEYNASLFQIETSILKKIRYTTPQSQTIGRQNRLNNIKGSFEVTNPEKLKSIVALSDQNVIILLDDVTTTGATLQEAAGALKASGARRVLCIALAH